MDLAASWGAASRTTAEPSTCATPVSETPIAVLDISKSGKAGTARTTHQPDGKDEGTP